MTDQASRMYRDAKTYNPFKGCGFNCLYCGPSFQRQAKRQRRLCARCYDFVPHEHPERLDARRIPNAHTVFVCGNGDISFCSVEFVHRTLDVLAEHSRRHPEVDYYLQSKRPACFAPFLDSLPPRVLLVTTLETNRDAGYDRISKAPPPTERFAKFLALDWPRKVVTVEPVMDFDVDPFVGMLAAIRPEHVWLGFNSRPKEVALPEPPMQKVRAFARRLREQGLMVRGKDLRGLRLPTIEQGGSSCTAASQRLTSRAHSRPKQGESFGAVTGRVGEP